MSINIGNNNVIKDSTISEKIEVTDKAIENKSFYEKHPIICGFLISFVAGIVLLFSCWNQIIAFIEEFF